MHIPVSAGDGSHMARAEMSCMAREGIACMARADVFHMAGDGDVLSSRRP
jgi:hypothetical protein